MKSIVKLAILLLLSNLTNAQQNAQFNQYIFNGIYINPAYAGYREQVNVHAFYHKQFTGVEGSPTTLALALDGSVNNDNIGLALQISRDKIGAQENLLAYANYAYRIKLDNEGISRLAFGIGAGIVQLGINGSLLKPDEVEPNQPIGNQSTIMPDARIGAHYSNDKFYVGLSVDHLISSYIDASQYAFIPQLKPHYYLTGGMLLNLSEKINLRPSFLLKDDRGGPTSLDLNAFVILSDFIWLGGSYRTGVKLYNKDYLQRSLNKQNSVVAAVQFFKIPNFNIGYAYDISLGSLSGYSGGSHEISVAYFFNKRNRNNSKSMLTPRYF
jgi:type IX secretion system PorP/SprF family membrane protein